jgi:hypothetical protein
MRFAFGASAAKAGTIASSSGNPIATPAPFKNVRLGNLPLVTITEPPSSS